MGNTTKTAGHTRTEAYATKATSKAAHLSPIVFYAWMRIKKPRYRNRTVTIPGQKRLPVLRYCCLAKNASATAPGPTCVPMVPPTVE